MFLRGYGRKIFKFPLCLCWLPQGGWPQQWPSLFVGPGRLKLHPLCSMQRCGLKLELCYCNSGNEWMLFQTGLHPQVDKLCPEPKDLSNWCFVQMGNSSLAFQQIVDFYRKARVHFEGKEEKKISPLLKNSDFACEDWGAQGLLKPSCLTWVPVIRKRWSKTLFRSCDHFEKSA